MALAKTEAFPSDARSDKTLSFFSVSRLASSSRVSSVPFIWLISKYVTGESCESHDKTVANSASASAVMFCCAPTLLAHTPPYQMFQDVPWGPSKIHRIVSAHARALACANVSCAPVTGSTTESGLVVVSGP